MTADERFSQFAKDPGRRDRLAAILSDPVFAEARDIVEDLMAPDTGKQADAVPAMAAAYYHQVAGANHFNKKLRDLTREPVEKKQPQAKKLATSIEDLPKK